MSGSTHAWKEHGSFVEDIEQQMDDYLKSQKSQIEQSLMEKINREKEEARRRIEETEQQFNKERAVIGEYKTVLAQLRTEKEKLVGLIHEHFDRTQNCQRQIKIMTEQANEELRKISELSREIDSVRSRVVAENARLKKELKERFGINIAIPATVEIGDVPPDWSKEAIRIEKIRDLLASIDVSRPFHPSADAPDNGRDGEGRREDVRPEPVNLEPVNLEPVNLEPVDLEPVDLEPVEPEPGPEPLNPPSAPPEPESPEPASAAPAAQTETASPETSSPEPAEAFPAPPEPLVLESEGFGVGRMDLTEDDLGGEIEAVELDPGAAPAAADETEAEEDFGNLLAELIPYKKTEPVQGDRKFGYFQNAELKVLDGEMFIRTMTQIVNTAKELHSQLGEKESIKDLFMLKQEILNEQEILRRLFLRAVVFCEKEDGSLPYYISEVINTRSLKDILERLTIGNWSDPLEFEVFLKDTNRLRDAFLGRVTNLEVYMKSVLGQLELND
jgi:hypothetical protein